MKRHWLVVADAATVRIFETDSKYTKLHLIEQLDHPETKLKTADLVSDDRGRAQTSQGGHIAYERHTDPHRATVHAFAAEVGARLVAAHHAHTFEGLVLTAPPVFMGELRPQLTGLGDKVVGTITKDFAKVPEHELLARIHADLPALAGKPARA